MKSANSAVKHAAMKAAASVKTTAPAHAGRCRRGLTGRAQQRTAGQLRLVQEPFLSWAELDFRLIVAWITPSNRRGRRQPEATSRRTRCTLRCCSSPVAPNYFRAARSYGVVTSEPRQAHNGERTMMDSDIKRSDAKRDNPVVPWRDLLPVHSHVPVGQGLHEAHDRVLLCVREAQAPNSARVHVVGRFRRRPACRTFIGVMGLAARQDVARVVEMSTIAFRLAKYPLCP